MVGLENGHTRESLTQNGEPQRLAGNAQEEEEEEEIIFHSFWNLFYWSINWLTLDYETS